MVSSAQGTISLNTPDGKNPIQIVLKQPPPWQRGGCFSTPYEELGAMLGYCPPAPEAARQWLNKFHDDRLMRERPLQGSFIPAESAALAGLKEPNRQVIWAYTDRVKPGWQVTFDVDAHLVETARAMCLLVGG